MEASEQPDEGGKILRGEQEVVVVGQDAPTEDPGACTVGLREKVLREGLHARRIPPDERLMVEAGGCDVKAVVPIGGGMRGGMPGSLSVFSPLKQFHALVVGEVAPEIPGHATNRGESALRGEGKCQREKTRAPHECGTTNGGRDSVVRRSAFRRGAPGAAFTRGDSA